MRHLQRCAIDAVTLQRRALHLSRWAPLDETGAFQIQDAATMLRQASALLEELSVDLLIASGRYPAFGGPEKAPPRQVA